MSNQDLYFVIRTTEDGIYIKSYTKERLLEEMSEWGNVTVLSELPTTSDPNYWNSSTVIIKGKVVLPQAKRVVEEFDID